MNPLFQTFAHTVVGQQASLACATAHHTHHQLANVVDRRMLEARAIGLVGCVVVRIFGGASLVQRRQHAIFLEWRAQNLHRVHHRSWKYFRHPTARERANEVSYFVPCCSQGCRQQALCRSAVQPSQCCPHLQECSSSDSLPGNNAGWDAWRSNHYTWSNELLSLFGCDRATSTW
jgi:hypothetical protein